MLENETNTTHWSCENNDGTNQTWILAADLVTARYGAFAGYTSDVMFVCLSKLKTGFARK